LFVENFEDAAPRAGGQVRERSGGGHRQGTNAAHGVTPLACVPAGRSGRVKIGEASPPPLKSRPCALKSDGMPSSETLTGVCLQSVPVGRSSVLPLVGAATCEDSCSP